MCFSPEASFIASAGLAVVGAETLRIAKKKEKIVAAVPLIFAVQQGIEGVQWLALRQGHANIVAGYAFLFFALLLWPIYIPLTLYRLDDKRRHILKWFIPLGIALSAGYLWTLLSTPLSIDVVNRCIVYNLDFPFKVLGMGLIYVPVVSIPFFLSSQPLIRWFGLIALISAFVAGIFFFAAFVSVWCFFAALLSALIYFYVSRSKGL